MIILLQYITVLLFLLLIATWREGSICILVFAFFTFPGFLVCVCGMHISACVHVFAGFSVHVLIT